jgi:RNA polymerase sigma-70 factor (ECF subfamily)
MTTESPRDEWLMAEVAVGTRDSLEHLIRRYATPLLTFIERMVGNQHQSEELLQDVFLAIWKNRRQYQFPRPFKPWLYAIAINRCRTSFRKNSLWVVRLEEEPALPATAAEPVDAAIGTETAALLANAVAALPGQQRAVIALKIWEGLSYAQIADVLDRTEGTVRAHMHHGLAALRKHLEHRLD